jgi:hypothetical protein
MAVKLALKEKQNIVHLYRNSDATTTQLAKQFGISTSTVVRLLQELMPQDEYRQLVSQKKADAKRGSRHSLPVSQLQINQLDLMADAMVSIDVPDEPIDQDEPNLQNQGDIAAIAMEEIEEIAKDLEDMEDDPLDEEDDLDDLEDTEDDLVDEDNLDLGLEDLDDSEDDFDANIAMFAELQGNHNLGDLLEILPINAAELPTTCYIVVDRISEIITRPLKDFKDLGTIPDEENLSKTIPIFDNHRVARRFSHHNQRVIKFPSDLILATRPHLVRKGITRILFSGQVYALN